MNDFLSPTDEKQYPITLIGEILVDEIKQRDSDDVTVHFGGSPANIALNLADMGIKDVQFVGTVGHDHRGKELLRTLSDNNISTQHINVHPGMTSTVRINQTDETPQPLFFRDADYQIEMSDPVRETISNSYILHFSYWPISKEPAKSAIVEAVKIAKKHDVLVGFDPNYHPLLNGENIRSNDELFELMHHIDIIKPSYDDARRIFGGNESPNTYLQMFIDLGIKVVIMTLGKDGLICRQGDTTVRLPSMATEVVDATGAGDAFLSGLYAAFLHNEDLTTALRMGLLCSAYNLKQVGGRSQLPNYQYLRQSLPE